MPKSLKEALLEQLDALQERGLAPAQVPEPEEPEGVAVDGDGGGDFDSMSTRRRPARARPRGDAPRRPARDGRGARDRVLEVEDGEDGDRSRSRRRGRAVPRERRPERAAEPVTPAPVMVAAAPVSRTDMLRERAEQRRRDQNERQEITELLSAYRTIPVADEEIQQFFSALTEEVGALPPLRVVVQALRTAGTEQVDAVGNQVRAYYRSARARRN